MLLTFTGLLILYRKKVTDKVDAYAYSVLTFSTVLLAITEILSAFSTASRSGLWLAWMVIAAFVWLVNVITFVKEKRDFSALANEIKTECVLLKLNMSKCFIAFILFAIILFILSVRTVPYNWDSMTYHLSRIMRWYQNSSVAHYNTVDTRQLASPQMADFINFNIYSMWGRDSLLNLLQTSSFLTNGIFIYYLSKRLGLEKKWSILATVLFYTTPIAFIEGFTTQCDNYAALLTTAFVYLLIKYFTQSENLGFQANNILRTIMLGMAIGLGFTAKPSVCIGMVCWFVLLLVLCLRRKDNIFVCLGHAAVAGIVALLHMTPELFKNIKSFGSVLPSNVGGRQLIGTLHPKLVLVNFYKTFSFNLPVSSIYGSDDFIYKTGLRLAEILHVDINYEAIAEDGREFSVKAAPHFGCDYAPNPIIVWLMIITIVLFIVFRKQFKLSELKTQFAIVSYISFVLFCAALRWEPFVSRYMISYFAFIAIGIVIILSGLITGIKDNNRLKYAIASQAIVWTLCVIECISLMSYQIKLVDRQHDKWKDASEAYFIENTSLYEYFVEIEEFVKTEGVTSVGLIRNSDTFEYPLFRMFGRDVHMEEIMITNETAVYENSEYQPDVVISCGRTIGAENGILEYNGNTYILSASEEKWEAYKLQK